MGEHLLGELVGERALTMIHSICLPSYDTIFPLSADSALSCTITGFVSLQLANNHLRNSMDKFIQAVWIHTLWTVQTEITCTSFITVQYNPPVHTHVQSHAANTPKSQTGNPAAPINQILSQSNPSQKLSCTSSSWVMSQCVRTAKKDK